ncbi:MAG: zinc-binding dehydrogenase family oxidoreductase [Myxococcales bacterium]|nr:zinc-binding dehydrogenase family oxidoreductase [Myxococcales bacterium]
MKAIVLTGYGDVDKLELREVPEPTPAAGELKVRVAAASVNPVDYKLRSGHMQAWMPLELPYILGRDASGEVVAVGAQASPFKVGDRVLGFVEHGYAEYVTAPANAWAIVPPALDLRDAAALPLVTLTGVQLIEEAVKPQRGDVLLVTGALGGVGRAAVFAAKKLGARVIAGVRKSQVAEAQKLGVESVAALDDAAAVDRLPPLDSIADTVGGETAARLIAKVKRGGVVGSVVGEPPGAKERELVVHAMRTHADSKRLAALAQAAAAGELIIPIAARFPLAKAAEAHQMAEKGATGKVLLIL